MTKKKKKLVIGIVFHQKRENEEIEILRETYLSPRERERDSTHKLYIGTVWFLESIRN